jgi:mannitol/fructose-specific phosphotransferase system IIA component (Ntr-type)
MGIIVAMIAYDMGVFNAEVFSAITMVCVLTSLSVGSLLKWAIKGVRRPLAKYFDRGHVFLDVKGDSKEAVIGQLCALIAERKIVRDCSHVRAAIWKREKTMSTAIGNGVALPHARIPNLATPIICFFRLQNAVDFGSPDNKPVRLLFLELTDQNDHGIQLDLMAQVARFVSSAENRRKLLECHQEEEVAHILTLDEKA